MRAFLWLLAALLMPAAASAHDLWMIYEQGRVLIRIGEDFPAATNGLTADRIVFLRAVSASGAVPLEGREEEKQFAAALHGRQPGPTLVELEVKPRPITLAAADFNRYIRGEGFGAVIEARRAAGASDSPGREIYSRYCKLLLDAPGDDRILRAPRGHRLEIVPLANPSRLAAGSGLEIQVLFDGKPLGGARVSAGREGMQGHRFSSVGATDQKGRVRLAVSASGLWYVRMIHMIPSLEPDAEWRSYFATLVFRITSWESR